MSGAGEEPRRPADPGTADGGTSGGTDGGGPGSGRSRLPGIAVRLLKIALLVAAGWYFARIMRRVNWPHVGASLSYLEWWHIPILLLLVLLRQALNAGTLALFVPGLGIRRAVMNDLTANLVSTVAPPPSDIALRMAMFQSWSVPVPSAAAGLSLNTLTYFVARFGAPALGFAIALLTDGFHPGYAWTAATSGVVALAIVLGLVVVTRGERAAATVGRVAGRLGHRVTPTRVDPDRWSSALVVFQRESGERLRSASGRAAAVLTGLLLAEGAVLVACLRFVGVPAGQVPAADVLVILLISYPLTALPFAGLGALDTAVSVILAAADDVDTSAVVAGLVVWRVCLLLVPLLLGALSMLVWRSTRSRTGANL